MPHIAATKPRAARAASLLAVVVLAAGAAASRQAIVGGRDGAQDAEGDEGAAGVGQAPAAQLPKPMDPEEARRRVLTLFEGALADTDNDQDFVQSQGYFKLLQILALYKPEDVAARAKALDYEAAMRDPNAWRGEFVRVRGIIADLGGVKLNESVNGQENVFQGVVTEADASEGVLFDILAPVDISQFNLTKDLVDIEGVFYRTVHYENKHGQKLAAPYILARTLTKLDTEELRHETHPLLIILLGGTTVLVAGLVAWNVIQGKRRASPVAGDPAEAIRRARERAATKHSKT